MNEEKHNINYKMNIAFDRAINNKKSKGIIKFNKPKIGEIVLIKMYYQMDVTGWNKILIDDDIRHMIKEHGNKFTESLKKQIAITKRDICNIPNIIENYDKIKKGNNNGKYKTIIYERKYKNNIKYLVEVIVDDQKKLQIKTMWKKSTIKVNDKNL